jgi:TatD DNase family protein
MAPVRGSPIELFDSHCHLTDTAFRKDREAVLRRAAEAGVTRFVSIASNIEDARAAASLVRGLDSAWCTAGVHPHEAGEAAPDAMERVRELAGNGDVVAIGETGLDFFYDNAPRDVQRTLFDAHLALGAELDLPVVVHSRSADEDVAAALRNMASGTMGVLHCFTGGDEVFAQAMSAEWYVSFSGIASFKSFGAVDLLREVPLDRILIETDAPYLAPVPLRGTRNEPAHVVHVAEAVARHLGSSMEDVARQTTLNACRFYSVS